MPKYVDFFRDQPSDRQSERRRMLAEQLRQVSQKTDPFAGYQGRITPKYTIGHGLTQLGAGLLARYSDRKADESEEAQRARRDAELRAAVGLGPAQDKRSMLVASLEGGAPPAQPEPTIPLINGNRQLTYMVLQQDPKLYTELVARQGQQPDPTDDQREYAAAREGGYQGTFEDFLFDPRRRSGTTVNLRNEGTIPTGYKAERDAQGNILRYVPIEGGPAAQEAAAAAAAAAAGDANRTQQADIVTQEIDRALHSMQSGILPDTGGGALLQYVPGTDAQSIANNLKTIKANIGFNQLQKMREASPTGGALGAVSKGELDFLQSVAGSLAQSQRQEDLTYNLNRLWNAYQDVIHGPGKGPQRRPLEIPGMASDDWQIRELP